MTNGYTSPRRTPQVFPRDSGAGLPPWQPPEPVPPVPPRGRRYDDLGVDDQAQVQAWLKAGVSDAAIEREMGLELGSLAIDLPEKPEKPRVGQYEDELALLKEMLAAGEITEEEYQEGRRRLAGFKTTAAGGGGRSYLPGEAERLEREMALAERGQEFKERSARAQALIDEVADRMDRDRLTLDQAIAQFNRQLQTSKLAADIFSDLQQFALPEGTEYIPGQEPGGVAEAMAKKGGYAFTPRKAQTSRVDPMAIAQRILAESDPAFQQAQAAAAAPQSDAIGEAYKRALAELGIGGA